MASIILFDGECNFCNFWVNFIIRHDKTEQFHFAGIKSEIGSDLLSQHANGGIDISNLPDSVILLENGQIYTESKAALKILRRLSNFWPLYYLFSLIPGFILDPVYRFIAAHRYRLFGRNNECLVPTPSIKNRFL
ncbi:MAG: DCC1-like thiol-disulfide oxidoreductase family protein [Acidobacteriota bacterium]